MSPIGGGAELLVRELNKRYLDYDIDAVALYFRNATSEPLFDNEFCLNVKSVKSLDNIFKIRRFIKNQIRQSTEEKVIVHAHLTYSFFFVALATLGLNVTLVYTEHNSFNRRRKYGILRYFERYFYKRYCSVICISEGVRKNLLNWIGTTFKEKVITINNGARLFEVKKDRRQITENTKLKIVSVGSLTRQKGYDIAFKALKDLFQAEVDSYTIVGTGSEREDLEYLAGELGIKNNVVFAGWSDNIEEYLNQADLFLISSRWEGFGLVVVEALSTGLPVLASNVDGLNGLFEGTDCPIFYFENENPSDLINQIRNIKHFLSKNEKVSEIAHKCSQNYSLEKMTMNYIENYKKISR